jgi:serpin B
MKLKTTLSLFLAALLLLSCFTGCAGAEPTGTTAGNQPQVRNNEPASAEVLSAVTNAKPLGFTAFDSQLVEYLKQTGKADENFTVSPLSFKAALTMAALGAEGETQAQLLAALGFRNLEELRAWYSTVLAGADNFEAFFAEMEKENAAYQSEFPGFSSSAANKERQSAYRVVNSVWSNQELPGEFRQSFLDDIAKTCRAEACSAKAAELADAVNAWVKEQTNGLIPSILDDASEVSAVLVNALYLKSGWESSFRKLEERAFTTVSGETVQKPFMGKTSRLNYYSDEKTQLVRVPLQGGMSMVFVLGDDTNLAEKLSKAESRLVELTVPMFDVETSLDKKELVNYLRLLGCDRMFDGQKAEFDPMYTSSLYVGDIIQKAKVHIDEEGLEAAAVTALAMYAGAMMPKPEEPVSFCADRPFSFYVVNGGETPELLFWGQIVK